MRTFQFEGGTTLLPYPGSLVRSVPGVAEAEALAYSACDGGADFIARDFTDAGRRAMPFLESREETATALGRARSFIAGLSRAAQVGEDDAIEFAYSALHDLVEEERFPPIDFVLRSLNVNRHRTSVLLSILTATSMANVRRRLVFRDDFYSRVKECLDRREGSKEAVEELLHGLD